MLLSQVEQQLLSDIEQMEIIDSHEHLYPEHERVKMKVDVSTLFTNYSDLGAAGMPGEVSAMFSDVDLPVEERWRAVAPYWKRARWTSWSRAVLLSIQKHYDADDLTEKTAVEISERMAAENVPGLYDRMLREDCNIRAALTQCCRTDTEKPLLTPVMALTYEGAAETWENISSPRIESWDGTIVPLDPNIAVHTLDDFLEAHRSYIRRMKSEGTVGLKTISLPFKDPDRKAAEQCFGELKNGTVAALPYDNPLRDYVHDEMVGFAGEQDITVAVHAHFAAHTPLNMISVAARHPETRFDLYHLGLPWARESLYIAKYYHNVWIDLCGVNVASQRIISDTLDEAIDLLPSNKIIGVGADNVVPVEMVYGHVAMTRENIARALARRIESGQMGMDDAVSIAHQWLFDNPKELYKLDV